MVIDDAAAFIGSLNWEMEYFEKTGDYAVMTADAREVREVIDCFEADWSRKPFEPRKTSNLIWCPGPGRERIAEFIDAAKHSLFIQNERYQAIIVEHIVRAKLRGVKVHIMTRPSHSLRPEKLVEGIGDLRIMHDVGIGIRKIRHLKLHAKMLLASRQIARGHRVDQHIAGSFDSRRELAILLKDDETVSRLSDVVEEDWEKSRALDLSDKGLLADLQRHPTQGGLLRAASVIPNARE